ncbi:MAG: hypothetical protein LCH96_03615 [Actinobacteria bacterium]|nr:hypothetical protein [Actinomycetota bacterium]
MSALLVDDLYVTVPTRPQPGRWRHVENSPQARPQSAALPGGRPQGVTAPPVRRVAPATRPTVTAAPSAGWHLTDRGIAVVVVFFLAVVATAAAVLVTGFLSVSNDPLQSVPAHQAPPAAAAVSQG